MTTSPGPSSSVSASRSLLTVGLVLMVTAVAFEGLAAPTVLPDTLGELSGLALYGWVFSGFWLSNLLGIALAGEEADRRGPFLPFVAGSATFAAGLIVAGTAPDMAWVVIGRAIQGLGAGAIGSITYVAIARGYPRPARPRIIAVISSAWVVPGLVGPALAGWVSEAHSWRWVFLGLAPLLPVAALVVAAPLRELSRGGRPQASNHAATPAAGPRRIGDAILLVLGAWSVLAAISWGQPIGILAGLAGAVLAFRALRRLLPPGAMAARTSQGAAIAVLGLVSAAFFGVEAFVPLAVASVRNAGTIAGGLALTSAAVTWAIGSWVPARLAGTRSRRALVMAGLLLIGAAVLLETSVPLSALAPTWVAALAWAIGGLGMGLAYSTTTLVVIEAAMSGSEGAASAAIQLANTLGIAVGTGVAGGVVAVAAAGPLGLAPGIVLANLLLTLVLGCALVLARRISAAPGGLDRAPEVVGPPEHGPALAP